MNNIKDLPQSLNTLLLMFGLLGLGACNAITLEKQFKGIESCQIHNIFFDPVTKKPSGEYFIQRNLEPCRLDEAAFYCVNDTFYGLSVSQIAIPYQGPFSVHALYLKESPAVVKKTLSEHFKGLTLNQDDERFPKLIADPQQQGSSVFYCDEYSE
jgi:hypothetical protein